MKTAIYGPVTEQHLADASLFAGIEPTEFVTDARSVPPFSQRATLAIPVDPKVGGEAGLRQQHWRMVIRADALICVGENEHLCHAATRHGLLVYQVDE